MTKIINNIKTAATQIHPNNLNFFPTLEKRKKEFLAHKARVMKATQANTPPKLTLHMLSANSHKKNKIIILKTKNLYFYI